MLTLIQFMSFDSVGQIYRPMIEADPVLLMYFVPFLLIVSIVLMNLVTAIIVEAFLEHAKQDQEMRKKADEQRVKSMLPHLQSMFGEIDEDRDGNVTLDELERAPDALREELSRCLNSESLAELWEILDTDLSGQVSIDEFCDGIMKLHLSSQPLEFTRIMKQISRMRDAQEQVLAAVRRPDNGQHRFGAAVEPPPSTFVRPPSRTRGQKSAAAAGGAAVSLGVPALTSGRKQEETELGPPKVSVVAPGFVRSKLASVSLAVAGPKPKLPAQRSARYTEFAMAMAHEAMVREYAPERGRRKSSRLASWVAWAPSVASRISNRMSYPRLASWSARASGNVSRTRSDDVNRTPTDMSWNGEDRTSSAGGASRPSAPDYQDRTVWQRGHRS